MKKGKKIPERNTGSRQKAGGDSYGVGMRQKMGKAIDVFPYGKPSGKKEIGKPPKSLA